MKTLSQLKLISLALLVLLCLLALPTLAQDDPVPTATALENGSVVVISGEGEEGTTVTVTQPSEETSDAAQDNPIDYILVVVGAVIIVAMLIFGAVLVRYVSKLVPAETAASIYQSGVRMGLELGLNTAARTASPLDDEFFTGLATMRGFEVIKHADGHYEVKTPTATAPQWSKTVSG
jgi:hypothetical protein